MNQRRAAGSTGVAYIRWLLRARPADYMLALSVAGGSLPVVGKHLKPLGGVTAIGVWGARHASDFLSATAKDLLTPVSTRFAVEIVPARRRFPSRPYAASFRPTTLPSNGRRRSARRRSAGRCATAVTSTAVASSTATTRPSCSTYGAAKICPPNPRRC